MHKLEIHALEHKGELENEAVWFDVKQDIASLSHYLVCDTTYSDESHISNELRHTYWFKSKSVKQGDWIKLLTKVGTDSTTTNKRGTTTHLFYWNLGRTVWNKDGDCAVLFKVESWKTKR